MPDGSLAFRTVDIVLSKARLGTRIQGDVHDPLLAAQTESIQRSMLKNRRICTSNRLVLETPHFSQMETRVQLGESRY